MVRITFANGPIVLAKGAHPHSNCCRAASRPRPPTRPLGTAIMLVIAFGQTRLQPRRLLDPSPCALQRPAVRPRRRPGRHDLPLLALVFLARAGIGVPIVIALAVASAALLIAGKAQFLKSYLLTRLTETRDNAPRRLSFWCRAQRNAAAIDAGGHPRRRSRRYVYAHRSRGHLGLRVDPEILGAAHSPIRLRCQIRPRTGLAASG